MKKQIALLLCFLMVFSVFQIPVGALYRDTSYEESLAHQLKTLGLFKGVSETNFELNRAPTRVEALVMLIRVLGVETEAVNGSWWHPFYDVPSWADKYVGYAYQNGLTNGISATEFGTGSASAAMYITFVLRALGFNDTIGDFTWNNPFELADKIGLTDGVNLDAFWRADVVRISYFALEAQIKGSSQTLAQKLISLGVFSEAQFISVYKTDNKLGNKLSTEEIYQLCSPAVFYIEVYDANKKLIGSGSGFFIDPSGIAVTNYHVIEGASYALIQRSDNDSVYSVLGVYNYSVEEDWAVIKIDGNNFPVLNIGDTSSVVGGASIYTIGSPQGLQNSISDGIVSNTSRVVGNTTYIQITAPISAGSSGGALLNDRGQVIGITSAMITSGQNLNLAVPIDRVSYSNVSYLSLTDIVVQQMDMTTIRKMSAIEMLRKVALDYGNVTTSDYVASKDSYETMHLVLLYMIIIQMVRSLLPMQD